MRPTTLRRATPDDLAGILAINAISNGEDIGEEMRVVFEHGGMAVEDYAVAAVDGDTVATVGLLAASLQMGPVTLPVGQPEYIATDPEHRGQGLARRLLDMVHGWSADRGDLVQVITGVPYFYRQYGYSYGLVRPRSVSVPPEQVIEMPAGWEVRPAESADIARIRALQAIAQAPADVAMPFTENLWLPFLALPAAPLLVAVHGGRVGAVARVRLQPGSPVQVQALAAETVDGLKAVLAGARARCVGASLIVAERTGSFLQAVVGTDATFTRTRRWSYVRVPSLAPVLGALTPVLDERLANSLFAAANGAIDISLYRSSVRLVYEAGKVVDVAPGPAIHEPDDDVGAVGVPPDLVPRLLFGEGGAHGIEEHPDVHLGRLRPLMAALFPPLRLDLLTW
jgi:GNAT superfamily N-acetyltransferase